MSKFSIDEISETLKSLQIPTPTIVKAIKKLEEAALEAKEERDESKAPKGKNQFIILASDPEGKLAGIDLAGWVLTIEESSSPVTILDRIKAAAKAYNESRKGRLYPTKSIGETIENVARKFWKTEDPTVKTLVKSKTPLQIVVTNNQL